MQDVHPDETLGERLARIACQTMLAGERAGILAGLALMSKQRADDARERASSSAVRVRKLQPSGGKSVF
jgi:hypothetical protein